MYIFSLVPQFQFLVLEITQEESGLEKRGKSNRKSHTDRERGGEEISTSRKEEKKKRIKMSNKPILLNAFWSLGGGVLTHTRWRDINTCHCLLTQLVELILCFSSL